MVLVVCKVMRSLRTVLVGLTSSRRCDGMSSRNGTPSFHCFGLGRIRFVDSPCRQMIRVVSRSCRRGECRLATMSTKHWIYRLGTCSMHHHGKDRHSNDPVPFDECTLRSKGRRPEPRTCSPDTGIAMLHYRRPLCNNV